MNRRTVWRNTSTLLMAMCVFFLMVSSFFASSTISYASTYSPGDEINNAIAQTEALKKHMEEGNMEQGVQDFGLLKKWWNTNKNGVKMTTLDMALEIDRQIAGISLALLNKKNEEVIALAGTLQFSLINYRDGAYIGNDGKTKMTLSTYIMNLRQVDNLIEQQKWSQAQAEVKQLQQQWLTVEGDIVSKSQTVYNNAERDLVLIDAYLTNPDQRSQVAPIIERMITSLTPLADAQYSWWDAALIPLREGLEGLLVVGTLLMYAKKASSKPAQRWIIGGSAIGIIACIVIGFIVAFLLTSGTFGRNNSLINGWTGVLASCLLLYVSYWLHRNADVKRWNRFIEAKSTQALSSGKMISLALLAFFAIVREGMETVIFLIGMVGKMPGGELTIGIVVGFGILGLCAVLMIKVGTRLPIRPVFLVSSLIVFYLCFKFMGSGIHSLQMAGVLPARVQDYLPEYVSVSLYPSWYSTLPQLIFVLAALIVLFKQKLRKRNPIKTINSASDAN
ncbi:FTR1 family iron permease [Paenibacillus sp. KN14-4R]|uniref:FTR1 family iron permease n=1 Tax=Paenibacillus sp. KN14-4R TaxID=3445773 RepID=UPI003FA0051E